ncbi:MAG: argininosuccinate synthase [Candidatus Altiarchaeales archaeon]|nr:MAG: argininosuccinate synthase [Candidatus Altiarchaeales archaeon]
MKIVLAYSGGLDTSLCIKWLQEKYDADVITLTLELGQSKRDLKEIEGKALDLGAIKTYSIDARREFVDDYVNRAIKANAMYEGRYPVSTAIARPLISKYLVEIAEKENADAVAHGSTGKGNDQVRFDCSIRALNSRLRIITPVREWKFTRDSAIRYARENGIPIPVDVESPYSIDENLWGRSIESGILEDPMVEPREEIFEWTRSIENCSDEAEYIEIEFEEGIPKKMNGKKMDEVKLITKLNEVAGMHGIGRIDMIEDRIIGIKSREIYECPAASVILEAHRELERLTLTREENLFKEIVDKKWAELVYFGLWHDPLREDLDAFIDKSQEFVSGSVRLKLFKGNAIIVGRESESSLYDLGLATYDKRDVFKHEFGEGFTRLWGLPSEIAGRRRKRC